MVTVTLTEVQNVLSILKFEGTEEQTKNVLGDLRAYGQKAQETRTPVTFCGKRQLDCITKVLIS